MIGGALHVLEKRDHRLVAGNDSALHDLLCFGHDLRALGIVQPFDFFEFGGQGGDECVLRGAALDECPHPEQRLRNHEIGRHDTVRPIILDTDFGLAENAPELGQPREISLGTTRAFDDMTIGQKLRGIDRYAGNLIDAISRVLELALPDEVIQKPGGDLPGEEFLAL
jgi:hypothetical protein